MREFLFGRSVGDWKRKNPLRFALAMIAVPASVLLFMAGSFEPMTLLYISGIWIVVAVFVIYLPLKLMYWIQRKIGR